MALTQTQVSQLYVAIFGRASEGDGNTFWQTHYDSMIVAADTMLATDAARIYFGNSLDSDQAFIEHIYLNTLGKTYEDDPSGINYWVNRLSSGESRGSVVDALIYAAQQPENAGPAQDMFNFKVCVSDFTADNVATANVYDLDKFKLDSVTGDIATCSAAIQKIVDITKDGIDAPHTDVYNQVFTLEKVVTTTTTTETSGYTETYWGDPDCADCNMTIEEFYTMVTNVTGLDLAMLGLANINADDPINDVQLIVDDSSGTDCCGQLVVTTSAGEQFTSELAIAQKYIDFLDSLIYYTDENGNKISRFTTKTIDVEEQVTSYGLTPIILTTDVNNGGTWENGLTNTGNDLIVAGQAELLHGAYIDGGAGYNTLEVDMKGFYAQPIQLLNIQEIHVQNLPNVYGDYYDLPGDANGDGTNVPDYVGGSGNSILDLSRAISIEKLVINEGTDYLTGSGDSHESSYLGELTVVGVRNGATLRLEGGFSEDVTVQYGQGLTGVLNLELALGDVTADINLLQNAAVLNIDSQGIENHMHNFFAGGSISRMYILGEAAFGVDEDLADSFNDGRPAIIDARGNTGGIDVTLNEHYNTKIYGTAADDEVTAQDSGYVLVNTYDGDNVINVDGSDIVTISSGDGFDQISARDGDVVSIEVGDGKKLITTDGNSQEVTITTGTGNNIIHSLDSEVVTIMTGDGNNNIVTDDSVIVSITTGDGNDTISSVRGDVVTISAGEGTNNITVSALEMNITTGSGNDTLVISGMDQDFVNGDDSGDWNDDNYDVGVSDFLSPGALINIDVGAGTNTITLGRDPFGAMGPQFGITALEGSVISGSGIKFIVENDSDLTEADLSNATITSVMLKQELTLTAEQFSDIGAAAFSVYRAAFGATEDLHIIINSDTTLSDLVNLSELSLNVRLNFEIRNGATLTLSAEELHKYVQWHGIDSTDGLNGQVVITDAGLTFNAFDNGPNNQVIDGGSLSDNFLGSEDVTILRSADGFNRPAPIDSSDTTTIDSSITPLITDPVIVDGGNPTTLKIIGDQDIVFTSYVDLGDGPNAGNAIDFSELDGTVTGLTVKNFDNIISVAGNSTGTRINVEMSGDVGSEEQGLVSSGVETYVVTGLLDNDDDDGDADTDTATFYLCDETQDVEVIGISGLGGKTVTFANVPWGLVAPTILLEGDGYADWNGGLKADGNPDASDIGTVVVEYFTDGAPAVVNINNGGTELGVTSTGAERGFFVEGIELENAASLTLNVTEGDAVIDHISGAIETLTVDATEDVSVTGPLPSTLTVINASGVDGMFTAMISPDGDFVFTGAAGGSDLAIEDFTAGADTSIDGGAAGMVLTIIGDVDLQEASLANVESVVLADGSSLTVTMAQADAIEAADFSLAEGATSATLNLVGLDGEPFAVANYAEGIDVGLVSIVDQPVVTLHPDTDLTGIAGLLVPEGVILNLTAEQFQQLGGPAFSGPQGYGSITGIGGTTNFTVNITDLTQADVDVDYNGDGDPDDVGFPNFEVLNLSQVDADHKTITLAESVTLDGSDDLAGFDVFIGDDMTLALADIQQADGLNITGGTNSTLQFNDMYAGPFESIDASGFDVTTLRILNILIDGRNVDLMFSGLSESVTKDVYNDLGMVDGVTQTVVLEEGTTVPGFVVFNKPEGDVEIQNFVLDMNGGTEINGNLRLSTSENDENLIPTYLKTVTINSTGTAENLITGDTANVISGDLTSQGTGPQVTYTSIDNNLLDVTINGDQEFVLEGSVIFESVTEVDPGNYHDGITANDDEEAIAVLTVNDSADVYIGGINTDDEDVDGLDVVNNGTGILTVKINGDDIDQTINGDLNDDALSFTGSGDIHLIIDPTVDLSDDDLSAVTQIMIADNGELYLSQAQIDALGIANLIDDGSNTLDGATLHIVEFGSDPFDATMLDPGIDLQTITIQSGNVALDPTTNLTGVDEILVHEDSTLTLTAAQFQQLVGTGTITGIDSGDGGDVPFTVNITGLTQADIDAGFDLSGIDGDATVTLSLAEDVNLDVATDLDNLDRLTVILDDNQTLGLASDVQADGLNVEGGVNSTIVYQFVALQPFPGQIDASGYNVTTLKALAASFSTTPLSNVEYSIDDLPSSVELRLYEDPADLGFLDPTYRRVVIEEGITTPTGLSFNDWDPTDEVRTLDLTLLGDVTLDGDLRIPTRTDKDGALIQQYFQMLTIHSEGTLPNTIDGDISTDTPPVPGNTSENNLLDVNIAAMQDLEITGDIIFRAVEPGSDAQLTVGGTADVTVNQLVATDPDIDAVGVMNDGTGTLTVTGSSPAIDCGSSIETLVFSGSGDIVLGDMDNSTSMTGIEGSALSLIDASGRTGGTLNLGEIADVDGADFTLMAGGGVTIAQLTSDTLDSTGVDTTPGTADDTAGWMIDYSSAAAGSEFHLGGGSTPLTLVDGSILNIDMGANGVLYIDESMDLSDLDLSIVQTMPIVLADGAILTLTAGQADGLTIIAGDDTGTPGFTGMVNIVDLGDAPVDLSGIALGIAGIVSLEDDDVTLDVATDLGDFTVYLQDISDADSLAGQTIRYTTVDQADNAILVGSTLENSGGDAEFYGQDTLPGTDDTDVVSSTNVVWLFEDIAAPVDTSGYDGEIGRLWLNDTLITNEGGDIENLFTTLPNTVLRVDFGDVTELNILLNSNAVNRIIEFTNFVTLGDLTFNDMGVSPVEHIQNLTMKLGGEVTIGNVAIDDVIGAPGYDPASVSFDTLTIESHRALHQDDIMASEGYVNDNDGIPEVGEHELPANINTIGDIGVNGYNNIDLLDVEIHTLAVSTVGGGLAGSLGAAIETGTLTYDSEVAGSIAELLVDGSNNVTMTSVDTSDTEILGINTTNNLGGGAVLNAPGASPAFNLDNTESWYLYGTGDMTLGSVTNAGVVGNELSDINASGTTGDLNFGIVADIDGTDDLAEDFNGDGDMGDRDEGANIAFTFTAGTGINTMTLGMANGRAPELETGSTWSFTYTGAATGSSLTIADTAVFQSGAILSLTDVPLIIEGAVDLSEVVLDINGATTIWVPAGQTLILSVDQLEQASMVDIVGDGTVQVVGDASDITTLGTHLRTVNVDLSAVTIATDADSIFEIYMNDAGAIDDNGDPAGFNVVGTASDDYIDGSELADTFTMGAGNDEIWGDDGDDIFNVDEGIDTIDDLVGMAGVEEDVIVVSAGATADATLYYSGTPGEFNTFVATADTVNDGTAYIRGTTDDNNLIDVSLAGGANGFTLVGSADAATDADTLIGSEKADVINGGNLHQTAAAAIDILTGNGGADVFQFDVDMGNTTTLTVQTTQANIDQETLQVTVAESTITGDEVLRVNYTVNGAGFSVDVDLSAVDVTSVTAIAAAIATEMQSNGSFIASATSGGTDTVTVTVQNGYDLEITGTTSVTNIDEITTVAGEGTDTAQVATLTATGTPTAGDSYVVLATLNNVVGSIPGSYTAVGGDAEDDVVDGIGTDFNLNAAATTVDAADIDGDNLVTFTDENADDGGFALATDTTAAFGGSGASNGTADYTQADIVTDFVSGSDKIEFYTSSGTDMQAGSGANYLEAAEVATYAAALANANTAFTTNAGTLQYYLTSATDMDGAAGTGLVNGQEGAGMLFFDANLDGTADGVILLTGVTDATFAAFDITVA